MSNVEELVLCDRKPAAVLNARTQQQTQITPLLVFLFQKLYSVFFCKDSDEGREGGGKMKSKSDVVMTVNQG